MATGKDKFEVYQDKRGEWRWRRLSANGGRVVGASCEGYKSKSDCEANMNRGHTPSDKWEFYTDKRGKHRWRRYASNGKMVGAATGGFDSRAGAEENATLNGYKS